MTPLNKYQQDVDFGLLQVDPQQAQAVAQLQRIFTDLRQAEQQKEKLGSSIKSWLGVEQPSVLGLYLWGGVGIGKTYLMDLFYQCLPNARKLRQHFHAFMRDIHQQLQVLQGKADPLTLIAKDLSADVEVICLDEFIVSDIGDAMILANLLHALFAEGITLITTSNIQPDLLYEYGLQRDSFLPAIALLKKHLQTHHVAVTTDYRLRHLQQVGVYFNPLDEASELKMRNAFAKCASLGEEQHQMLMINKREIPALRCVGAVVWFRFDAICHMPRSQHDYLEIANLFHTVFISGVPKINGQQDNIINYFIHLVDVFYDAKIKLILSAEVPINEIYQQGRYLQTFERTKSRLLEMQTEQYLHAAHKMTPDLDSDS